LKNHKFTNIYDIFSWILTFLLKFMNIDLSLWKNIFCLTFTFFTIFDFTYLSQFINFFFITNHKFTNIYGICSWILTFFVKVHEYRLIIMKKIFCLTFTFFYNINIWFHILSHIYSIIFTIFDFTHIYGIVYEYRIIYFVYLLVIFILLISFCITLF